MIKFIEMVILQLNMKMEKWNGMIEEHGIEKKLCWAAHISTTKKDTFIGKMVLHEYAHLVSRFGSGMGTYIEKMDLHWNIPMEIASGYVRWSRECIDWWSLQLNLQTVTKYGLVEESCIEKTNPQSCVLADTKPGTIKENAIAKKMQIAEKSHIMMAILLLKRASLFPTQIHGCILMEVVALLKEDLIKQTFARINPISARFLTNWAQPHLRNEKTVEEFKETQNRLS